MLPINHTTVTSSNSLIKMYSHIGSSFKMGHTIAGGTMLVLLCVYNLMSNKKSSNSVVDRLFVHI